MQKHIRRLNSLPIASISFACATILVVVQLGHLFTKAELFYSDSALKTAQFLDTTYADKSIAVIQNLELYSLLKNPKRSTFSVLSGVPTLGSNPFDAPNPFSVIVAAASDPLVNPIPAHYKEVSSMNGYTIYERE